MELESNSFLELALGSEERNQIPSEIAKKLEDFITEKFDELLTARALSETSKHNTGKVMKFILRT